MGYEINTMHTAHTRFVHTRTYRRYRRYTCEDFLSIFVFFWFAIFCTVRFVANPTRTLWIVCRHSFRFSDHQNKEKYSAFKCIGFRFLLGQISYWNYNECSILRCWNEHGIAVTNTKKLQVYYNRRKCSAKKNHVCEVSIRNNWKSQNKLFSCWRQ